MTRKPFGSSIAISVCLWVYSPKSMADCVTPWAVVSDLDNQAHTRFMNMSDANRDDFTTVFCHDYMDFHCYAVQGWPHWELSTTEWAEWSNAAWIVNFGITSDNMPTGGCVPGFCVNFNDRPWHGRRDYRRLGNHAIPLLMTNSTRTTCQEWARIMPLHHSIPTTSSSCTKMNGRSCIANCLTHPNSRIPTRLSAPRP